MKSSHNLFGCFILPSFLWDTICNHTIKVCLGLIVFFFLSSNGLAQDTSRHDPLFGRYILANSAELVCLRDFSGVDPPLALSQRLFDFLPNGQIAQGGSDSAYTNSRVLSSTRWIDGVVCDINADGIGELVTAWAGSSNLLNISVSNASPPLWNWTENILYGEGDTTVAGPIRIVAANLDTIPGQEIVVGCLVSIGGQPSTLMISLYDSIDYSTGKLVKYGSQLMGVSIDEFDMSVGDFDGDGLDEIIIVYHHIEPSYQGLGFTIADFPERRQVNFWPGNIFVTEDTLWNNWKRLKITAGNFRRIGNYEAVVSITQCKGDSGRQMFSYVSIEPQSQSINVQFPLFNDAPNDWPWGYGWESDAEAADLNPIKNQRDGDELIVASANWLAILNFNNVNLKPVCKARIQFLHTGFKELYERTKFIAVTDVNADTVSESWIPEIILAEYLQDSTSIIQIFSVNLNPWNDNEIVGMSRISSRSLFEKTRKCEIVVGDFDGDAIRLAKPNFIRKKSFYQPIIQLNVPPTHFDFINNQIYDISNVFGPNPSQFKVTYSEISSTTSYFKSELKSSWGLSSQSGGGSSFFGFSVKAKLSSSYELGYYQSHSTSSTTTASQVTTSWGNDWILATIADYDLWEYPLYVGGVFKCGVLVQIPHYHYTAWFDNKDTRARDWTAEHEVGNIFSYIPVNRIPAYTGGKFLTSFNGINLSPSVSGSWALNLYEQNIQQSLLTNKVGTEFGASIGGWGMEAKLLWNYSGEEISTHTSIATDQVTISVDVGELTGLIADVNYTVIPYIYWGKNGSLVLDYAVEPSLDNSGDPNFYTFWQKNYLAHSDPAFILPWRLDSLKGIVTNPELKLYSKDLRISPAEPSVGDMVRITATVHNFSLTETGGPVIVRFYNGNPLSGGTPIADCSTLASIPARDRAIVTADWQVPSGLSNNTRIYAVIDPDNMINEIHEDNNIGFILLKTESTTGIETECVPMIPKSYSLEQNYPNPFNLSTIISYQLPTQSHVTLKVFDVLGREVETLVNDVQEPGFKSQFFNATDLASGIYFYRLQTDTFTETKKLVLLK